MATSQPSLSSSSLYPINHLTRLSRQPGNLDYDAYRQYLALIGHIRPFWNDSGVVGPAVPQNTYLQNNKGDRDDDKTDCRADQALWTQDNLPDIIYVFVKPNFWLEKHHLEDPPMKTYPIYGSYLRDLPILPDHISHKIEGWRIEAWMRFDPRLNLVDIMARMEPGRRPATKSVVQMRTLRFRKDCNVLGWVALGKNFAPRKDVLKELMTSNDINPLQNSTRGISWGLIDKVLGEDGGRIKVPANRRQEDTVDVSEVPLTPIKSQGYFIPDAFLRPPLSYSGAGRPFAPPIATRAEDQIHVNRVLAVDSNAFSSRAYQNPNYMTSHSHSQFPPPTTTAYAAGMIGSNQYHHGPQQLQQNFPPPGLHAQHQLQQTRIQSQPSTQPQTQTQPQALPPNQRNPSSFSQRIPTTVFYHGRLLTLKTPTERARDAAYVARLCREWHPPGSDGRRLQLAYLLDPVACMRGWVDNRGHWPPVAGGWECIEADIVYRR